MLMGTEAAPLSSSADAQPAFATPSADQQEDEPVIRYKAAIVLSPEIAAQLLLQSCSGPLTRPTRDLQVLSDQID